VSAPYKAMRKKATALTATDFRRLALSLPEVVEGSHFGQPDFRVGEKIFATLALECEGYGVLLLTPEQQAGMVEDQPEIFSPVPGGGGERARPESTWRRQRRISWKVLCEVHGPEEPRSASGVRNQTSEVRIGYGFAASSTASVPDLLKPKRTIHARASRPRTNFHCCAACMAWRAKYLLGPGETSDAVSTLPAESTPTFTRTLMVP